MLLLQRSLQLLVEQHGHDVLAIFAAVNLWCLAWLFIRAGVVVAVAAVACQVVVDIGHQGDGVAASGLWPAGVLAFYPGDCVGLIDQMIRLGHMAAGNQLGSSPDAAVQVGAIGKRDCFQMLGGIVGGLLGAALAQWLPLTALTWLFAALLVLTSVRLALAGWRSRAG